MARRPCGGELGALLSVLKEVRSGEPGGGSTRAPQPQHTRDACMGRGDSPSRNWNALQNALLLRVSALWMGSPVSHIDDAREAPLSRRALCCCARFSRLLPSWRVVIDCRRLAAVAFEVSLGTIVCTTRSEMFKTARKLWVTHELHDIDACWWRQFLLTSGAGLTALIPAPLQAHLRVAAFCWLQCNST